jgi:protein-S-isoprenylcysteine O-methyltransferase Ste14
VTAALAKGAFVLLVVGWYLIRFPYARRSRSTPVSTSARGARETALLLTSLTGLGILPLTYVSTGFPHGSAYPFHPAQAWLGTAAAAGALVLFRLTHRALGRSWSVTLEIREQHKLRTDGIYGRVRHPMYSAFWLWAVAQALLLPNWVAGSSGLVGFGILYFGRVRREEGLMIAAFGDEYRAYMRQTGRLVPPWPATARAGWTQPRA